jgi:hypothetical protein
MKQSEKNSNRMNSLPTEYPFQGLLRLYLGRLKVFIALVAANLVLISFGFLMVKAPALVVWLGIALVAVLVLSRIGGIRLTMIVLVVANFLLGIGYLMAIAPSLLLWLAASVIPFVLLIKVSRLDRGLVSFLFGPTLK